MCAKQVIVVKQNIKEQCPQKVFTFKHRLMLSLVMEKVTLAFCFFVRLGLTLGAATEPFHRHVIVSPHSSSEIFYTGAQRQIVAPAPVYEQALPVAAPAAPVPAVVPAPHLAFATAGAVAAPAAPLAFPAPASAVAPAAPLAFAPPAPAVAVAAPAPVVPVAKVAQIKLSYPQYAYGYSVQDFTTGDNKVAKEVREGGVVKGSYSVADPDGTKRTVNYYADPIHGFNAVVHKTQILK